MKRISKYILVLVVACLLVIGVARRSVKDILAISIDLKNYDEIFVEDEVVGSFEVMETVANVKEPEVIVDEVEEALDSVDTVIETEPTFEELPIEEKIRVKCEEYNVDFEIALAIARLETGWFKSDAYIYRNNPGGLSRNEIPIRFDTIEEGVEAFVSNLSHGYFEQGLDTPDEIGKKYCPVDPDWASKVKELMKYGITN